MTGLSHEVLVKYRTGYEDKQARRDRKRKRRGLPKRDIDPPNPFPVAVKQGAELPKPPFAYNDPRGKEEQHFDKRLVERTINQQEADEVRDRVAQASRHFKLHADPKLNQNNYAVITHRFPERASSGGFGTSDHLMSSVKGTFHPDFKGHMVPTATTMYDGHNSRDYSSEYTHMLDMTTNPPSKTFLGYGGPAPSIQTGEPMDMAWQLLKQMRYADMGDLVSDHWSPSGD